MILLKVYEIFGSEMPLDFKDKCLMKCWASLATLLGLITFVWQCWMKFDPGQKQILFFVVL